MKKIKKIKLVFSIFLILLFVFALFNVVKFTKFEVNEYPYNKDNVFILTVDDISLDSSDNINSTEKIIQFIKSNNIPATFFVVPSKMKEYDFPDYIEIAQHGYTHLNPKKESYYEFDGLSNREVTERMLKGKEILNNLGYDIYGFRVPGLKISKSLIPFLKENYNYDSSFLFSRPDKFVIPILWDDISQICGDFCVVPWMSVRKFYFFSAVNFHDLFNKPIILITHSWAFANSWKQSVARDFHNDIFDKLKTKNYWFTNIKSYVDWKKDLSNLSISYNTYNKTINLNISNCVNGLTIKINSVKDITSNCDLNCFLEKKKKICVV